MLMTILNAGKGYTGIRLENLELIRQILNQDLIPFVENDRYLYPDIKWLFQEVQKGSFIELVEKDLGKLKF